MEASDEARNGGWQAWAPFWMCGPSLEGATVGVVGFGRIGQEVAKRILPFGVKQLLYHGRTEKKEGKQMGAKKVPFDDLLQQSDFVIVTCALTPETTNLFNDSAFKKMKKTRGFH
ncbi:unnamed protein product [Brassicogethes aeneus]|uniref:D-isomer specific 2-hydroxyacid dehydrogenase NAD-binding domain-containing protein n=1 Tax=Brassicogethes aeneus TaxID=1431903 RepID=A0A9P0FN71_BRAAE|nr:unnamed protein product [Brassicogethes aeneus]